MLQERNSLMFSPLLLLRSAFWRNAQSVTRSVPIS